MGTPKAKLRATPISFIETKVWKCPKCLKRFKRECGLSTHFKSHSVGKLPEDIAPSASQGKTLPKIEKKRKGCMREQRKNARKKGSSAKTRVRNIEIMKEGVKAYEDALQNGETAEIPSEDRNF